MSGTIDLKVARDKKLGGLYDLTVTNGALGTVDNFDTALQMSVYCERRADGSEVLPSEERRGWWGNVLSSIENFEIGSKLWVVSQSRLTRNTLNRITAYAQDCTDWLVQGGYLEKVEVETTKISDTGVRLVFNLYRTASKTETKFFDLWTDTESYNERSL